MPGLQSRRWRLKSMSAMPHSLTDCPILPKCGFSLAPNQRFYPGGEGGIRSIGQEIPCAFNELELCFSTQTAHPNRQFPILTAILTAVLDKHENLASISWS